MVQEEMSHAVMLKVPVKVNIKTGKNWMQTE
jgi:DNA polymerase-1